jgi:hypothetical protein
MLSLQTSVICMLMYRTYISLPSSPSRYPSRPRVFTVCTLKSKSKSHYDWRSVSLGVEPNLGLLTRVFFSKLLYCLSGAPSLTRGRVCHLSVFVIAVYNSQSLYTLIIYNKLFASCCVYSYIPYILESNRHPFYSFRGLKIQMRIRIECGLDSRSRAGFW